MKRTRRAVGLILIGIASVIEEIAGVILPGPKPGTVHVTVNGDATKMHDAITAVVNEEQRRVVRRARRGTA